jgi:hypothetical protein
LFSLSLTPIGKCISSIVVKEKEEGGGKGTPFAREEIRFMTTEPED